MKLRERAQMIVWIAIMVPMIFLPIAGLSIDAGVLFDAKRDLQNVADGAARAGAMEIDLSDLHDTSPPNDLKIFVDQDRAPRAVNTYLNRIRFPLDQHETRPHDHSVDVVVWRDVTPRFLSLLHIGTVRIHATSRAQPCAAVVGPGCD